MPDRTRSITEDLTVTGRAESVITYLFSPLSALPLSSHVSHLSPIISSKQANLG